MRAAVFHAAGEALRLEQVPDPRPGPGEVLIEVARAGICGSDLQVASLGAAPAGTIFGHEFAGRIVELAPGCGPEWRTGDRVSALPIRVCGHCEACEGGFHALCPSVVFTGTTLAYSGAYAQYLTAPVAMLQRLPDGVGFDEGAMVEPLAVACHAVQRAQMPRGARVLVLGAGPIGAGVTLFAARAGATRVVVSERAAVRRERALALGATAVIDPLTEDPAKRFSALCDGRPQVVFECTGKPGMIQQAVELAGLRGRVVVVGLCLQEDRILPLPGFLKELSIDFAQCYHVRDFEAVIDALARGQLDAQPMHTATVGLPELPGIFAELQSGSPHCKVLIDPTR